MKRSRDQVGDPPQDQHLPSHHQPLDSGGRYAWPGEELEMAHQRESRGLASTAAAVNLEQFRNYQVGKGYQAKSVIRQPSIHDNPVASAKSAALTLVDYKPAASAPTCVSEKKETKHKRKRKSESARSEASLRSVYLSCKALRDFRREIETICASDKPNNAS